MRLTLGTRGSQLAMWQAEWVASRLRQAGIEVAIQVIKTSGDRRSAASSETPDGKGLFVKEIEEALMAGGRGAGGIDLAVHSLKDLPVDQPDGLYLAAIPPREDARDALIVQQGAKAARLTALPPGAHVGTGSTRRRSQLLRWRPDLKVTPIRGNVDTRLRKLDRAEYDAIVMAAAGLRRLGLADRVSEYFSPDVVCPAAGQGALAIEIRRGDGGTASAVEPLDDYFTHLAVRAERAALRRLGGGCETPIAAYARQEVDSLSITGLVASPDGERTAHSFATGPADDPEALGRRVAEDLLKQGARELLHL